MKIKGPGNYSGLPAPPEDVKGGEVKGKSSFSPDAGEVKGTDATAAGSVSGKASSFETNLRQIAGASGKEGVTGDATVNKVVDSVLEQMLGNEFLGKPEAASLKNAVVPMLSQDENFMSKLNHVLARLQKS